MRTDENYLRENGIVLSSSSTTNKNDTDDVPDYNEAFPRLTSTGQLYINHSNPFFSLSSFNGTNAMNSTTSSLYSSTKIDEDRRRKQAIHEKSATTKIVRATSYRKILKFLLFFFKIEIPPEERVLENIRRVGNQSTRNSSANNSGPPLQKICTRIQKETCKTKNNLFILFYFFRIYLATNITFFNKDQTLIVTITGRPEQVRSAQVQILRELQKPVKISVNVPLDFHKFIIGTRGTTLKLLEQETLTRIAVPSPESQSNLILVSGAKDNVKLCEQKILELYHIQFNKGYERLLIPHLYHPWIRYQLVDELYRQLNVKINLPPPIKQTDEISIRGEREPVEQAKIRIMQFFKNLVK